MLNHATNHTQQRCPQVSQTNKHPAFINVFSYLRTKNNLNVTNFTLDFLLVWNCGMCSILRLNFRSPNFRSLHRKFSKSSTFGWLAVPLNVTVEFYEIGLPNFSQLHQKCCNPTTFGWIAESLNIREKLWFINRSFFFDF